MVRSDADDSRRREDAAIRLEQKFQDFLDAYGADKDASLEWQKEIENKMIPLIELHQSLTRPAKVIGAVLMLMMTPLLGFMGWQITRWVTSQVERVLSGHLP